MHNPTGFLALYDVDQLQELEARMREFPEYLPLSFDREIDMALTERGIAYVSIESHRPDSKEGFLRAEEIAALFEQPEWAWLSYRDIPFGRLFVHTLQGYFISFLYHVAVMRRVCAAYPSLAEVVVLPPMRRVPVAGAFIAQREIYVVTDAIRTACGGSSVTVTALPQPLLVGERTRHSLFVMQRALFSVALTIWNACMKPLPKKRYRMLVSDYWRHVAPMEPHLHDVELVFLDRAQVTAIPLRTMIAHRMRFVHAHEPRNTHARSLREEAYVSYGAQWQREKDSLIPDVVWCGVSLRPILTEIVGEVVEHAVPRMLVGIDEAYALLEQEQPDVVVLRATVSEQWHFPLLALGARQKGIPSFELLHGLEYPGPGSVDRRHVAQYLGVYGPFTQSQMMAVGLPKDELPIIGSPRFDVYVDSDIAQARVQDDTKVRVFVTIPDLFHGASFDTYDAYQYLHSICTAVRAFPQVEVTFKLRPGPHRETLFRGLIKEVAEGLTYRIAQYEPLASLFAECDIAISCQSTVTIEALQCGVPLIAYAATSVEALTLHLNFDTAVEMGAVLLPHTREELRSAVQDLVVHADARARMTHMGQAYLRNAFTFDGRAAERAATCLLDLARTRVGQTDVG